MQVQGKSCVLGTWRRGLKWLALLVVVGCAPRAQMLAGPSQEPAPSQATLAVPTQDCSDGTVAEPRAQRDFGEFLVIRKNGDRIVGRSGSLAAARLTGVSVEGRQLDIAQDDIRTLYLKEGSLAGKMALYGAGLGLAFSSLVLLRVGIDDPHFFQRDGAGTVSLALVGGSTALGALIGSAFGAAQSQWRVEPVVVPGQQYSLQLAGSL